MGSGSFNGERSNESRDLASLVGPQRIPAVLLPFEKQLAATIGLTDQEYVKFKEELERNSKPRPAEYAHIPDVRCDPTGGILTSLVVGLLLTAASALLAPKPKAPKDDKRRQIRQADLTGPTRYNTTYGFDSVGDVATWATVIPIPFGKYVNTSGVVSGGLVIISSGLAYLVTATSK